MDFGANGANGTNGAKTNWLILRVLVKVFTIISDLQPDGQQDKLHQKQVWNRYKCGF